MSSLREAVRRLLGREPAPDTPDPEYSYTVYWTKVVREWDETHRSAAQSATDQLISDSEFQANPFGRRYSDPAIDGSAHSGESLLALQKVLSAFGKWPEG